ncbi:hypothetical protein RRG08_037755 [Elysia crispata]|uniref:Uncharacterized protein n=1 Tax=Elysia crispata TaxID=231223 RepID=A0AAE1A985_9GAST|nr:hypothetical protein RRG08_037755 [Elysia crispata]KAK3782757.1 hypothetical protein RRG08_037755 [Elysia crispata]
MDKLKWMLVFLAVVSTSGQEQQPAITLGSSGPTPFRREPPGPQASSGPSPVFREPFSLNDSANSPENQDRSSRTRNTISSETFTGSGAPELDSQSSKNPSNSGDSTNPSRQVENQGLAGTNSINIENANGINTIVTDPEAPIILYQDDVSPQNTLNVDNARNHSGESKARNGGLQIPADASGNSRSNQNINFANTDTILINDENAQLDLPLSSERSPNSDDLSRQTSSRETSIGKMAPDVNNAIPSGNRLINSDSRQTLLDFQPGRSSLYVSVPRPLQVSSAPVCTFPQKFGEDQFELSTSEFGYPKSIVQQALKDSLAEAVLKTLTDIMYEGVMATQVTGYPRNRGVQGISLINNNLRQDRGIFGLRNPLGSASTSNGQRRPMSTSFGSLDSSFGQDDFVGSDDNFRLTSDSNEIGKGRFDDTRQPPQNRKNVDVTQDSGSRADLLSDANSKDIQGQNIEAQGSKLSSDEERGTVNQLQNNNDSADSSDPKSVKEPPSPTFSTSLSSLPTRDFGTFESFNNVNPFLQRSRGGTSLLRGNDRNNQGGTNIDRLFPPKASDMFLDTPPSPVGGEEGDAPFISYNDRQQSRNVDSPFQFNSRSLFGSLPSSPFRSSLSGGNGQGSSFGSSITGGNPQGSSLGSSLGGGSGATGVQRGISSFGPSNFGSSSRLFDNGNNNGVRSTGTSAANQGFPNPQFGFSRTFSRKKRQTSQNPDQIRVKPTCSPTYKLLRQYKNYNGACFVVMPESQGVYFAECSNSPCSGCKFEGGASRCTAERVPMWVWSYCEAGPNKGKVMPDRVQVSVTCSCKTTLCQSALNGR